MKKVVYLLKKIREKHERSMLPVKVWGWDWLTSTVGVRRIRVRARVRV